jgi:uncharacterized protein (DUF697 family)
MTNSDWLPYALGISAICCLVPFIVLGVLMFLALRQGNELVEKYAAADSEKMRAQYDQLQRAKPNLNREKLVEAFIHSQSIKCGVLGALTSFGGFITLPITLPVDILVSLRIQATMVQFIATAYGHNQPGELEKQVQSYLIMTGGMQVTEKASASIMKLIVRLFGQTFSKFVPIVGAVVGFGINYFFTQAAGRLAAKWYAGTKPKSA